MIDQLKAKIDYQLERGDEISIELMQVWLAATKGGTGSLQSKTSIEVFKEARSPNI